MRSGVEIRKILIQENDLRIQLKEIKERIEMYLMRSNIFGEAVDKSAFQQYAKETLDELIADFENETSKVLNLFEKMSEADLGKTVQFAGMTFTADRFALMMLLDQVHHRGQLSVYVRMAGGKVPSIYGPLADDSSTNL